jgi:hypothetical protein
MLGVEGPDVEILDAVAPVHVVQGRALAQGPAQESPGVPAGSLRIPAEQLRLGVSRQRGQPEQVSYLDPRHRPIRICAHAAILSRRPPILPPRAWNGMRRARTFSAKRGVLPALARLPCDRKTG